MNSRFRLMFLFAIAVCGVFAAAGTGFAQNHETQEEQRQFGPVVTAYLGYLRNEQEVVDDRVSRREISRAYYRRNSNRIRALREIAMRIARETHNDYLPELEAVAGDELGTLFERPPSVASLAIGKVFNNTFRFVGSVRSGELFYIFARLDPYEQAERKARGTAGVERTGSSVGVPGESANRPRRVRNPWKATLGPTL